ncbi:Gap junction beta-5 protein [Frankliniella fusca]|uniref:Gap junction beta-5 protein n=1 Tax=Frankliniella fusca TaxID=407009 RepID=A0AAE1I6A5_9NEOP|nr:Gap junction beta-5 protein [Frankliniella fusca]
MCFIIRKVVKAPNIFYFYFLQKAQVFVSQSTSPPLLFTRPSARYEKCLVIQGYCFKSTAFSLEFQAIVLN